MLIQYEKYEDINLFLKVLLKKNLCLIDITTCSSTHSSFIKPFSFIIKEKGKVPHRVWSKGVVVFRLFKDSEALFQFAPVIDTLSLVYLTLFNFLLVFSLRWGLVRGCELGRALEKCGWGRGERLLCDCNNFSHSGFLSGGPWFFLRFGSFPR